METLWENVFGSLQKTIFAVILVLIVVPATLLGVISYGQYWKIITANTRTLNLSSISQIVSNTEGVLKSVRNSSSSFCQNDMARDYLPMKGPRWIEDTWYGLSRYTLNQPTYEEYIYAVDFVRMDGQRYSSSSVTGGISEEVREILLAKNGETVFRVDVRVADYGGLKSDELYGYARCIHDISDIGTPIGLRQIYLEKRELLRLLNDHRADGEEYYIVGNGNVIIPTGEETVGIPMTSAFPELNLSEEYPSQQVKTDGTVVMTAYAKVKYPGWYVVKQISLNEIDGETAMVYQLLILAGILAVVLCTMTEFFLSRLVIQPLKELESPMKHIEEDNLKRKLPEEGYQELSLLARAFNRMSIKLDELVNRVYPAEIREKDAQIRTVQAYINPHSFYSTLDIICWMGRVEQAGETCKLIEALSKLFRASMKDTGKAATVAAELEYIRNYIMIWERHYTGSIKLKTEATEEVVNRETVRFVLQPLVESTITHGLGPIGEQGTIWIKTYGEQGKFIIFMEGNDFDVDVEELEGLLVRHQGGLREMGSSGVSDRIRPCYGEGYGIQFGRREPKGLIVRVVQPPATGGGRREGGQYD